MVLDAMILVFWMLSFFFFFFWMLSFRPAFLTQVIALIQILNLGVLFQQPNTLLEQSN